jgi:NAD(P)-dependent dehydrogenase (short-subunit alcohol dehydrogenase family)
MRLKDRVALITGAASGIGKAIAVKFACEGALIVIADKDDAAIPAAVEDIEKLRQRAVGYSLDVSDPRQCHSCVDSILSEHKRIDILINNAGVSRYRPFLTLSSEDWDIVLSVDLKGVFFCSQAVAPAMMRQEYGKIVNISSALGTGATPHNTAGSPGGSSAYASAKAGVIMLTKTLARELGPYGVNVNCVAPGTFLTPMSATTRNPQEVAEHLEHRKKTVVLGRIGTLEELASSVLFFASDESSYVTGHTLFVDGGRFDRM